MGSVCAGIAFVRCVRIITGGCIHIILLLLIATLFLILRTVLPAQRLTAGAVLTMTLVKRFQIFTLTAQIGYLLLILRSLSLIAFLTVMQTLYGALQCGNGQTEALDGRAQIIDGVL